jgi:formylglycine-generating enzyme required for sulfatase activity
MHHNLPHTGLPRQAACLTVLLLIGLLAPAHSAERALRVVDTVGHMVGLYQASYALVIGVSDYTNGWPDLPGVEEDIAEVSVVLKEQGFDVTIVKNPDLHALREAFDTFINRHGLVEDYRLLMYFAGHGHTIKPSYGGEIGYIVPADAPNPHQDLRGFFAKAMDMQQIEVYAKRIQAKHAMFLFDSCFSGSIFSLSRAVPEHINYKTSRPVRQFITSGSADEQVPDKSVFRQQFISGLRGEGDANGDGYVTGTELGEFLQSKVVNYSRGAQHPQYGKLRDPNLDKGDFVFKIVVTVSTPEGKTEVEVTAPGSDLERKIMEMLEQQHQGRSPNPEAEMWALVRESTNAEDIKTFLQEFPDGPYAPAARLKLQQLERGPSGASPVLPETPTLQEAPATPSFPASQVRQVQRRLKLAGLDPGPVDGMFGRKTQEALHQYQASRNLPVTGLPDEATAQALQEDERQWQQAQHQPAAEAEPRSKTEIQVAVGIYPTKPAPPAPATKALRNSMGMEFALIPAGDFTMGSYSGGLLQGQPAHKVVLSQPFYMGKYEVTQAQWVAVMGNNPSYFKGDRDNSGGIEHAAQQVQGFFRKLGGQSKPKAVPQLDPNRPVERVSWDQVQEFIRRLNAKEGHDKYRLPTEAEWEYAARAGSATNYSFGDHDHPLPQHAWYAQNAGRTTHAVGQLKPNAWGLYDMYGNVLEWVLDWWGPYSGGPATDPQGPPTGTLKVLRGCSWLHAPSQCRSTTRVYNAPKVAHISYGFRLVKTVP